MHKWRYAEPCCLVISRCRIIFTLLPKGKVGKNFIAWEWVQKGFFGRFSFFSTPTYRKLLLVEVYPLCLLTTHLMPEKAELCWQLFVSSLSILLYSVTPSRELKAAEYLTVDNQNWESRNCGTPPFDIRQKVMTFGPSKRSSGSLFDGNSTFLCWRRNSKFSFCQKMRQFFSKMIHLLKCHFAEYVLFVYK